MSKIKPVTVEYVDRMWKEIKEEAKKHPIRTKLKQIYYRIYHFIDDIPLNIRSFLQRGRRGWSSRDTWGFSGYLANTISKGLRHLKENRYSHPIGLTEGQWVDILNEIIETFEIAREIDGGDTIYISSKEWSEKTYKELLHTNYKYRHPHIMTKKECIEFEEGWKKFQQYYFSLWD